LAENEGHQKVFISSNILHGGPYNHKCQRFIPRGTKIVATVKPNDNLSLLPTAVKVRVLLPHLPPDITETGKVILLRKAAVLREPCGCILTLSPTKIALKPSQRIKVRPVLSSSTGAWSGEVIEILGDKET
jgi:hypothetical protein